MRGSPMGTLGVCVLLAGLALARPAAAQSIVVQCPGDTDGDAVPEVGAPGWRPNVKCRHLTAGDGFAWMADGREQYIFGFGDITGMPADMAMHHGMLGARVPAPTIELDEGDELYLTLTNVGMMLRPDLFDPHSVHWHGFPQAAPIFDGMPDGSISINMGASLTYYYKVVEPGTYMYHCHVEATEHMQMGMLGNLYVRPAQDGTPFTHGGRTFTTFAYNDGDGSTGYDVAVPVQMTSFDADFHDASLSVQPLPFALMKDDYALLNGRGYPDTVNPGLLPVLPAAGQPPLANATDMYPQGQQSSPVPTVIRATAGERILLRISNLSVTRFFTLATFGLPMRVVGWNARLLRGPGGQDMSWATRSVTLGGGESADAIVDTAGVAPGTYFLYTTNLNYLSNNQEDLGGMMAEIVIQ